MFIVFEGVDGTGKSTQVEQCRAWIQGLGREVTVCRDPGSTELGLRLRDILLKRSELKVDVESEMFLFMAARSQMVTEIILPALEKNNVVLCDRFLLSTVVYQGHAGKLDPQQIWQIGQVATRGRQPDLTIVFDAPLQITMRRLGSRIDRMESRGEEFFSAVRRGFLAEAARNTSIQVVDAGGDARDIHVQVRKVIESCLELPSARR